MLGAMINDTVVGNYSAAVRISEFWFLVPGMIGVSIYPILIKLKEENYSLYRKRIQQTVFLMSITVLPIASLISINANIIANTIYGDEFKYTGGYLSILIWSGVPYLVFFVTSYMIYIEKLTRYGFYSSVFAIFSNIIFNLILIPYFEGKGAAMATLITAIGSIFIMIMILNWKTGIFIGGNFEKK